MVLPVKRLAYVESFAVDTSDCQVVVQFGTNDIYQLNDENIDEYVERYVKAVLAVPSLKTYLFCIFPRNDYDDYSTAVNKFIQIQRKNVLIYYAVLTLKLAITKISVSHKNN